jgi:hypothetical protein
MNLGVPANWIFRLDSIGGSYDEAGFVEAFESIVLPQKAQLSLE